MIQSTQHRPTLEWFCKSDLYCTCRYSVTNTFFLSLATALFQECLLWMQQAAFATSPISHNPYTSSNYAFAFLRLKSPESVFFIRKLIYLSKCASTFIKMVIGFVSYLQVKRHVLTPQSISIYIYVYYIIPHIMQDKIIITGKH